MQVPDLRPTEKTMLGELYVSGAFPVLVTFRHCSGGISERERVARRSRLVIRADR